MSPVAYADPTSWEEWQREYRYGALYVFPPPGVIEHLDALRARYDARSASYCQAHVSVSEPLPEPLSPAHLDELRTALARIEPFDLTYGPLRSFPPHPGVVYAIEPEAAFQAVQAVVHGTSLFAASPRERRGIAPHMTIAEFITPARTEELLRELRGRVPTGRFRCEKLEYAVPDERFFFERILPLNLGEAARPPG